MAYDAADVMAEKAFSSKIERKNQELTDKVTKLVIKYVPAPVLACAKEYGDYLGSNNNAVVQKLTTDSDGHQHVYGYIPATTSIPVPYSCNYIKVDAKDFESVESVRNEQNNLIKERNDFRDKVFNALMQLRTVKKVEEEFPEAIEYLDIPVEKQLPSLMLNDIRTIVSAIK